MSDQTTSNLQMEIRYTNTLAITSSATPAINTNKYHSVNISALAVAVTSFTTSLTGTPADLDELVIRILDNGSARALAWGAKFEAVGAALPTTTTSGKRSTLRFLYDATTAKWGLTFAAVEA